MNAPEFHAERLTGIGSSDAAPACGVSRFRTRLDVYHEKRGAGPVLPDDETEPMRFGKLLEPVVLAEFARRTGLPVDREGLFQRSPAHPFMLAHLDARTLLDGAPVVVEAKTSRTGEGFGEPDTADIPIDYLVQTHHQMIVAECRLAFVPVLIGGQDFRIYRVPFDRELGELVIENERVLWDQIQRGEPPPIDPDSPDALRLIRKVYPGTDGTTLRANANDEAWRTVYHDSTKLRDRYATAADCAKAHLLLTMQNAALLQFSDGQALRRKEIEVKGYVVEPRTQIDVRFTKTKD